MVKHVVKPLFTAILKEGILPKKPMFTRVFSVFRNFIMSGRCLAPKAGALPTALHPEILYCFLFGFLSFSRSRAASGCCHQIGSLCSLFGQRPSFFLAASAAGGARKRPHLRYIPMINGTIITRCARNVKGIKKSFNPEN